MYILKFICSSVLLSAMPGSERLLPYKAFPENQKYKRRDKKTLRLFEHEKTLRLRILAFKIIF